MTAASLDYRGALEAVDRILNRGGEADDVLREVLEALETRGVSYGVVRFAEGEGLVEGPSIGRQVAGVEAAVVYEGSTIGSLELAVDDRRFVDRVAKLISPYLLRSSRR